ncbi:MAG: trigger factor, partial [Candidatus Gracilibacteria bacterium]|nr:trigger factor [Candidatus Gracilibacteria bacterium]
IDSMYREGLKKEKLVPVAQAEIKEIISESPLKIRVHIEVMPTVEIDSKYKKIKLSKQKISVSADEVKLALGDIEKKFTKFEEVTDKKTKIKMGDQVTIDTDGYEKEVLMKNTSMRDYPIVLGSNILVPGFEEGMVGAKTGDALDLDVNFPTDYHNEEFKGKKTIFKVTIKKFEQAVVPEFTEEFIEQLRGQKLDLTGFKKLIKQEITDTKEANARMDEEQKLIDELLKVTTLELGEGMIKHQIEKVFGEIKENLTKDGVKIGNYLESLKLSEEEYKEKNVKPIAKKRLQGELILHKLAELESFEVTDKEMKTEIDTILERFGSEDVLKKLQELYVPGNKYYEELKQRVKYRKLIDNFFRSR